jgi:DNA-binding MarR family transcriptional regulator
MTRDGAWPKADGQIGRFHREMVELIKKYQFRDRTQMTSCGVSVSQCYVLETLQHAGALTMNELALRIHLTVSTLTRVVDQLVAKRLVTRREDQRDRRYRLVDLTPGGRSVFESSWKSVFESEKAILEGFPAGQRESLIRLLRELNEAVDRWRSTPAASPRRRRRTRRS